MDFNKFQKNRVKTVFPHRYSKLFYNYWMTHKALWHSFLLRLKDEKDCFILVTGSTGSGKSNFVGNFCFKHAMKESNFILNDGTKMFIPKDNFIIDPDEFAYKMITKEGQVLWGDEFRRGSNRRNWYSPINKAILNRKNQNRKLFNIYFLCLPFEKDFDPALASHLTAWIWIRRGVGEVYCSRSGIKGGVGLNIQAILDREVKYFKENPKATIAFPTIHPEFVGRIKFGKLTTKLKEKYIELVILKKATGDLTDEEKKKYGVVDNDPKNLVLDSIKSIKEGKIKDKKALWNSLEKIKLDDDKKLKLLNFYLNLENFGTFNKLFKDTEINIDDIFRK